jgi:glycosyltransferase involved in cell wall biosynthesis
MRILVVQESGYLERGPHQGHHLLERMVLRGHDVHVIDYPIDWAHQTGKGLAPPWEIHAKAFKVVAPGVTVIRPIIIRLPILNYLSLLVSHRIEIANQIRMFNPDVIVGFGLLNARMAIRQGRYNGIPFVYYVIDELHRLVPEAPLRSIAKHIESGNCRMATSVLSINQGLMEYTESMGADPSKTSIIRAGVDFKRFSSADGSKIRQKYGFKDNDTVLFFMGWTYNFCGLDAVAEQLVASGRKDVKLLVLGKGELWEKLQAIRAENGLEDKMVLEGWKPYSEVPSYIAAADICLLPAQRNEIMQNIVPIKMYEYLAAGKPVIATDLPGIMKEFGQGNGVEYVSAPADAFKKSVELAISGRVGELGKKAQELVCKNDWDIIVDQFEDALRSLQRKG